jgi:hypothetical protein
VGFPYSTYYIYRGDSVYNFQIIDSVSATTFSYSDYNATSGTNYYRVTVKKADGCSPDGGSTIYTQSQSNFRFANIPTGIEKISSLKFKLSPNPVSDHFIITLNKSVSEGILNVYNVLGEKLIIQKFNGNHQKISCSLKSGIYFVELNDGKDSWIQKFIKD